MTARRDQHFLVDEGTGERILSLGKGEVSSYDYQAEGDRFQLTVGSATQQSALKPFGAAELKRPGFSEAFEPRTEAVR